MTDLEIDDPRLMDVLRKALTEMKIPFEDKPGGIVFSKQFESEMNAEKFCPLCTIKGNEGPYCDEENCAWWCERSRCCAMVAIHKDIQSKDKNIVYTSKE